MKQKYTLLKDKKTGGLTIQEHAELSKDLFSLICEETYDAETIKNAMGESKAILIDTLRTPNLYPISEYIEQIADKVISLYDASTKSKEASPVELVFDDVALFKKDAAPGEIENEESVEIEDLLEDDTVEVEEADTESETDEATPDLSIDTSDDESHESPDDTNSLS
ncbi:MAG: hypothetical protein R6T92_01005 [Desulfosalsimonadaceae bacterium]